jgi:hypothetical protein
LCAGLCKEEEEENKKTKKKEKTRNQKIDERRRKTEKTRSNPRLSLSLVSASFLSFRFNYRGCYRKRVISDPLSLLPR